jgi:hypothetical protein
VAFRSLLSALVGDLELFAASLHLNMTSFLRGLCNVFGHINVLKRLDRCGAQCLRRPDAGFQA